MNKILYLVLCLLIYYQGILAQEAKYSFAENNGQWENDVLYKTNIPNGHLYFTREGWIYNLSKIEQEHEDHNHDNVVEVNKTKGKPQTVHHHNILYKLNNANENVAVKSLHKLAYYENYFLGSDTTKWKSNIGHYQSLEYQNIYQGIDLIFTARDSSLKYDFILAPHANPNQISITVTGATITQNKKGQIIVQSDITQIIEDKPIAYQIIDKDTIVVPIQYIIEQQTITFELGDYDKNNKLIIDPNIIFLSYTGSHGVNIAHSAGYDNNGCLIMGSASNHDGFNTTPGAYSGNYQGYYDITLTKFNANGNSRIFATYFGGGGDDFSKSIQTDENNNMYIVGVAGGGLTFPANSYRGNRPNRPYGPCRKFIFVAKFNGTGTSLLGGTYYGGNVCDGDNEIIESLDIVSSIVADYNKVDRTLWIAFSTLSPNLDMTANALQPTLDQAPAAIIQFNSELTNLLYASYIRGNNLLTINDLIVIPEYQSVYMCGTTAATNIGSAGTLNPSFQGGDYDGFVSRYHYINNTMTTSYFGTNGPDRLCAIAYDSINNQIFLAGLSNNGTYPTTPNAMNVTNGTNILLSIHPELNKLNAAAKYSLHSRFFPLAIGTNYCSGISLMGISYHTNVSDLPLGPNAFQTAESAIWAGTFKKDLSANLYGTFIGNNANHTHGGQMAMDKEAVAYFTACEMNNLTIGTPNSFATRGISNLDVIGIKFNLFALDKKLDINMLVNPNDTFCGHGSAAFQNNSYNYNKFTWHLGNGTSYVGRVPYLNYTTSGNYQIRVVAENTFCNIKDTLNFNLNVKPIARIIPPFTDTLLCPIDTIRIDLSINNNNFNISNILVNWSPSNAIFSTPSNTSAIIKAQLTDVVAIHIPFQSLDNYCILDTSFTIKLNKAPVKPFYLEPDSVTYCSNKEGTLYIVDGNNNYVWPDNISSYTYHNNDTITVQHAQSGYFVLGKKDQFNCLYADSSYLNVEPHYELSAGPNIVSKKNEIVHLKGSTNAPSYYWYDELGSNFGFNNLSPSITVQKPTYFVFKTDLFPQCNDADTMFILSNSLGIPNAFSPNGDGLNDQFEFFIENDLIEFRHWMIFNRFGQVVFKSDKSTDKWDGTFNGKPVDLGVYYYIIKYKIGDEEYNDTGDITLIR